MKLSDYVADFLARQGIRHIFAVTGGASLHLIESVANHPDIDYVCPHHEQAGAMAADGYARVTGNLGAAVATSGPGGTNMITGICCAWYDSVPVLFLTGQVATFRFKGTTGVRQMGFQETDIVDICRSITKYAVTVIDAKSIRYELEKAAWIAREGRPGPVLVDIPDNVQREEIEPEALEGFQPPPVVPKETPDKLVAAVAKCLEWIQQAERPMVVLGWGVHLANAENEALAFIERLGLPVNPTWGAADLLAESHPLRCGTFGTHGTRFGNFAIQNADLVISIGSRLDTHMIGSPFSNFCRGGRKVMVDIDATEINKFAQFDLHIDLPIVADAKVFLAEAVRQSANQVAPAIGPWRARINDWKSRYPEVQPNHFRSSTLNPYVFIKALSDAASEGDVFFADTGCGVAWMSQAFQFKTGQRFFSAFNNTPMGHGLPAAIGACLALNKKRIVCVAGDGGLMMNIQELNTVIYHKLPVKIFVLNNHGYSMIQQTQDQWLNSKYEASSEAGGLGFPDFHKLAEVLGFDTLTIKSNQEASDNIQAFLDAPGPGFCNVEIRPEERVVPQVKYGRPIEDSEPLLPRAEFLANMIVEPLPVCKSMT
ncbi:MAG: thiamine pyrophosphate-binding protein [Proteobacteria bacterium]|nr:thiamine pyrophosphate-binding protein [Pseudomonadota bacterium]